MKRKNKVNNNKERIIKYLFYVKREKKEKT